MLPYGRNKTYRVVFEEKEKQKRRREKDFEDPRNAAVAYVDTARLLPTKQKAQPRKSKSPIQVQVYTLVKKLTLEILEISLLCWNLGIYQKTLRSRVQENRETQQLQVPK